MNLATLAIVSGLPTLTILVDIVLQRRAARRRNASLLNLQIVTGEPFANLNSQLDRYEQHELHIRELIDRL